MTEPIYADPYTRIAWLHEQLAAAEVREAQLLSLAEDLALWEPATPEHKAALDGLRALVVQPPDTREPRCPTCGHVPPNPRCELCCEEPPDTREEVNEPESGGLVSVQGEGVAASGASDRSGSLTSPAGGAPGGTREAASRAAHEMTSAPWEDDTARAREGRAPGGVAKGEA